MTTLVIHPATQPLVGSVPVPSDKSIGHRALLLGALCDGKTHIAGFSHGEDNVSTASCLRAMGVVIDEPGPAELVVTGVGLDGLRAPALDLDCGNSGTTMRLLCGILAGQRFRTTLVGDETLTRRPMMRVARPLRERGAVVEGRVDPSREREVFAPLVVGPLPDAQRSGRARIRELCRECASQERVCCSPASTPRESHASRSPRSRATTRSECLARWGYRSALVGLGGRARTERLEPADARVRHCDTRRYLGRFVSTRCGAARRGLAHHRARRRGQSHADRSPRNRSRHGRRASR
jgi:hypothetical protein